MTLILRNCDLDINGLIFNDPKPSGHGGQTIYVNYQKDARKHKVCQLQTPWMYNPFGLNSSPPQAGEEPKYSVECSFGNAPSAYMEEFHAKMRALDQHVIAAAIKNQRSWLQRTDVDDEYIQEFYKPVVRPYKNKEKKATGEFPDTIRFKIPYYGAKTGDAESGEGAQEESFSDFEVYDESRQRIPIDSIETLKTVLGKGNRLRVIAQCHSVWQTGQEFGVSWRVKRIQVISSDSGLGEDCAFGAGSEDDESGAATSSASTVAPPMGGAFDGNNSDEEEQ